MTTCPHCGADASAGQKFCPKCSRLVDSPLLKIKQQIDAARDEIRRDLNAARVSVSLPTREAPRFQVSVGMPAVHTPPAPPPPPPPSPSPYKYAPHPSQTPGLTPPPSQIPRETILRSQQRNQTKQQKKKRRDEGITRAQHSTATHRFDPVAAAKKAVQDAQAAAASGPVPERFKRPAAFTVLAILDLIGAIVMVYAALQLTMRYPEPRPPFAEFSLILAGAAAFIFLVTAFGMLRMHPYARVFQRILLLPVMLWVPVGTIYGVAVWLYLGTAITRLYFSGRSPRSLDPKQLAAWRTADKASPVLAVMIFAFGFIPAIAYATFITGTVPMIFTEAQRAFPDAMRQLTAEPALEGGASSDAAAAAAAAAASNAVNTAANDAGTPAPSASSTDGAPEGDPSSIGAKQVRRMQEAQAGYASLNEGYYDRLECILTPSMCIRNGDERNKAVLLDESFIPPQRFGYTFLLNQYGEPAVRSDTSSLTGTRGYSYRALPAAESGDRIAYCGDETGLICAFDAQSPDAQNFGRCPAVCRPLSSIPSR